MEAPRLLRIDGLAVDHRALQPWHRTVPEPVSLTGFISRKILRLISIESVRTLPEDAKHEDTSCATHPTARRAGAQLGRAS